MRRPPAKKAKESAILKTFLERVAWQPWGNVLTFPPPRGKRGSIAREASDYERLARYRQAISWLEQTPIGVVLWRSNTGGMGARPGQRFVQFGLPGMADIQGLMKPGGISMSIEVKTAAGKQSDLQLQNERMIRTAGGIYLCIDDAVRGVLELQHALLGEP